MIFLKTLTSQTLSAFLIAMNFTQFTSPQNIFHKTTGKLRISIIASIFLFSFSQLSAKEDTASQLEAIEKRLAVLEQENAKLKERISELEKGGSPGDRQAITRAYPAGRNREKSIL
jgi:cell division protein FtsB